jgi:trans-2,3-dihydro-3-hydroxyanthranilate isomerase
MRQPIPVWEPYQRSRDLLDALGLESLTLPVDAYRNGPRHVHVGVDSEAALARVRPDLRALATHPDMAAICYAGAGTRWRMRDVLPRPTA